MSSNTLKCSTVRKVNNPKDKCKILFNELISIPNGGTLTRNDLFTIFENKAKAIFGTESYDKLSGLITPLGYALIESVYNVQHIHNIDFSNLQSYLDGCLPKAYDDSHLVSQINNLYELITKIEQEITNIYQYFSDCCKDPESCYSAISGYLEKTKTSDCNYYGQIINLIDNCCSSSESLDFGGLSIVLPDFSCSAGTCSFEYRGNT